MAVVLPKTSSLRLTERKNVSLLFVAFNILYASTQINFSEIEEKNYPF